MLRSRITTLVLAVATLLMVGLACAAAPAAAKQKLSEVKQHGSKIDPRLAAKLASSSPKATVPVSIWLNVPDPQIGRPLGEATAAESRARLQADLDKVKDYMAPKRRGVLDALARMGVRAGAPLYAPAVFADLNRTQVQKLARRSDVAALYGPGQTRPSADDAVTTERGWIPWVRGNLGQGSGVRPVVHEARAVSDRNPFLNNLTHGVFFWCPYPPSGTASWCPQGKSLHNHPTVVAGEIASTHALFRGVAPSVQAILSANAGNTDNLKQVVNAFEWARGNGGDPFNMSWNEPCGGFQTFASRYVDWAVRNLRATVVVSAGNHPSGCASATDDEKVSSPGVAWSAITVGSYDDKNNGWWSDDAMNAGSDWQNPDFAPGMQKPEVVAPGTDIASTDNEGGDWIGTGNGGTSIAAAQVTGQVALMLARRPFQSAWPETNKAAVLASAFHDVETGSRERDGVGGVVINQSDDTYRLGRFFNDCVVGCQRVQASNFPRSYPISLTAGQRYRVAIAWESNPSGPLWDTGGTLGADIDLQVRDPSGALVEESNSSQNAWELVDFTAPVSGTYTVDADLFSAETGWPGTFIGMAYSQQAPATPCTLNTTVMPETGGTFAEDTANSPTFFDSYPGWGFNQSGRERLEKITLSSTKDIRVTDDNLGLDLHVLQMNCEADPVTPSMKGSGADSVFVNDAPAGTYYVAVDGRDGRVGKDDVSVTVSDPGSAPEFTDWTSADSTTDVASGTLRGTSVTLSGSFIEPAPTGSTVDGSSPVFNRAWFTPPLPRSDAIGFRGVPETYSYTLDLGAPTADPILHLDSLASRLDFPAGTQITSVSGTPGLTVSGSSVNGTLDGGGIPGDSEGTVRLNGVFQSVSFTATTPGYIDGINIQVGS